MLFAGVTKRTGIRFAILAPYNKRHHTTGELGFGHLPPGGALVPSGFAGRSLLPGARQSREILCRVS